MENNQNYEKIISNKLRDNPSQVIGNRPDRYESNRKNNYNDRRFKDQYRPDNGNQGTNHEICILRKFNFLDHQNQRHYESNSNLNYRTSEPRNSCQFNNRGHFNKTEQNFNRRDGDNYGYDNKYVNNNRENNQDRSSMYTRQDNTQRNFRDQKNEKINLNEHNDVNISKKQDDYKMANNYAALDDSSVELKVPSETALVQDSVKLDMNILTAIMVHQNNDNKKLIAKLSNQTIFQVEEFSKKEYYRFFADFKNKQEIGTPEENQKEIRLEPSNIPSYVIDENKNKSFYDALSNQINKINHTNSKILEIKKKIHKDYTEVKKLKDKIHDYGMKELNLRQTQLEIRKTLDEIFSEY